MSPFWVGVCIGGVLGFFAALCLVGGLLLYRDQQRTWGHDRERG